MIVVRDASKGVGDLGNTALGIAGVASAPETLGASLVLNLVSYGIDKGLSHWESCYARTNIEHLTEVKSLIRRTSDCPDDMFNDEYTPNRPPFDPLTINHDPAGYVYEAVPRIVWRACKPPSTIRKKWRTFGATSTRKS